MRILAVLSLVGGAVCIANPFCTTTGPIPSGTTGGDKEEKNGYVPPSDGFGLIGEDWPKCEDDGFQDRFRTIPTARAAIDYPPFQYSQKNRVCKMFVKYSDGHRGVCTGSMVGPVSLLTAAHCVWDSDLKEWATDIQVCCGYAYHVNINALGPTSTSLVSSPSFCHYGIASWTKKVKSYSAYKTKNEAKYDIALLQLDRSPIVGNFGYHPTLADKSVLVEMWGYAGHATEQPIGDYAPQLASNNDAEWVATNSQWNHRFYPDLLTGSRGGNGLVYGFKEWIFGGESGGPYLSKLNGEQYIIATHKGGPSGCYEYGAKLSTQFATEITKTRTSWTARAVCSPIAYEFDLDNHYAAGTHMRGVGRTDPKYGSTTVRPSSSGFKVVFTFRNVGRATASISYTYVGYRKSGTTDSIRMLRIWTPTTSYVSILKQGDSYRQTMSVAKGFKLPNGVYDIFGGWNAFACNNNGQPMYQWVGRVSVANQVSSREGAVLFGDRSAQVLSTCRACLSSEFDCGLDSCISSSRRCDGVFDCVNGKDEQGCTTSAPRTSAPRTKAPRTSAPLTSVPRTGAPRTGTSVPPSSTSAPSTSVPPTSVPRTGAPPTPTPSTLVPPTPLPPGQRPRPTLIPDTRAPPTPAPPTPIPDTRAPPTSAPPTPVPDTRAPPTPAPQTATPRGLSQQKVSLYLKATLNTIIAKIQDVIADVLSRLSQRSASNTASCAKICELGLNDGGSNSGNKFFDLDCFSCTGAALSPSRDAATLDTTDGTYRLELDVGSAESDTTIASLLSGSSVAGLAMADTSLEATSPPTEEEGGSSGVSIGIIIGVVIGVVVLLVIGIVVACCVCKKKENKPY